MLILYQPAYDFPLDSVDLKKKYMLKVFMKVLENSLDRDFKIMGFFFKKTR